MECKTPCRTSFTVDLSSIYDFFTHEAEYRIERGHSVEYNHGRAKAQRSRNTSAPIDECQGGSLTRSIVIVG